MKKAVIYARVSTKDQEREGYSIPAQLRLLHEYADKKNISVVEEYVESESAASIGRIKFNEMVKFLIKNKDVNSLIVFKIDRLFRNLEDRVTIDRLIYGHSKIVHEVNDNNIIDIESSPDELFMYDIKTSLARIESKKIGQRVRTAMDQKAREGKYPSGALSIGYLRNKISKEIDIDPDRAPKIRLLFEKYLEGDHSLADILKYSKAIDLKYRKSDRFLVKAEIDRILKRIFYTGRFEWKGQVLKGDHPQIIDTVLFDKVQDVINGRAKGKMSKKEIPFRRLMECGECHNVITGQIKKQKYLYYHCTGYGSNHKIEYVPEKKIDSQFAKIMSDVTIPSDWYDFFKSNIENDFSKKKIQVARERDRLELSRDTIQSDMRKSFQAKIDGLVDETFFKSVYNEYQKQLDSVNFRLNNLHDSIDQKIDLARTTIELSYQAESLYLKANTEQKRRLLKSVLSNCILKDATLYPTYNKAFTIIAEGLVLNIKRGGPHSQQTFVQFDFRVKMGYSTKDGTRWKTIE